MKVVWISFAVLLVLWSSLAGAQTGGVRTQTDGAGARMDTAYLSLHFSSAHNCFPDTGRAHGHLDGDSIFRPLAGHYDDSSVLLIIPRHLKADRKIDLVFWFHGWHNNIDTAVAYYGLARQFAASQRNAILVLPEAAKNAADSYGGKLQQTGMIKGLVEDVMNELKSEAIVPGMQAPEILSWPVIAAVSG